MCDTIHLRAADEATLAAALPWLRGTDQQGAPGWLTAGHHHALDPIGPLVLTPPAVDPVTGEELAPAEVDGRWHANLRVDGAHPEHDAIMAACEPFIIHPTNPRRTFA
ncbi:hypothetical protein HL658_36230 [Azospirillum sp. RWY-5-1]|uniref:Uncharacterized protein n=1 Tax=Azospirillum oleiclasticum TaxID=2735135 RepID=A0ABX2TN55_9PROT|nr:hypothetical protein [Azospirillum oleiclasticum]NYZ18016.1 hypothetical protein [Azospirillum oleiclasticum]NYZ25173.1 hypothetical protein [Azospirillum oleiclasticum]